MHRSLLFLAAALTACGGESRDDDPQTAPTSVTASTPGGSSGAGGTTEAGDDSSESGDPPPASGVDPDGAVGCEAVDFLFVIDNSGSMADEQQHLIDSVPGFVTSIEERLPPGAGTYHIMVTDVDPWQYEACGDACSEAQACELASATGACDCGYPCALRDLCLAGDDYVCGVSEPEECEDIMGAGIVHPRGRDASNVDCSFASGQRYINSGEPDLTSAFDCAARVGTNSSLGEKPMEAMVQALAPSGAVSDCNAGFLRSDAVLVVVLITDEDDNGPNADDLEGDSVGNPQTWFDAVVEAKGGNADAIVTMALIGDSDAVGGICAPLDPVTFEGAEPAPRIRQFVELFGDQGIVGSVCSPTYNEFFMTAVDTIGQACDEFVPAG